MWQWFFAILAGVSVIAVFYGQTLIGLSKTISLFLSVLPLAFSVWKLFSTPRLSYDDIVIRSAYYRTASVESTNNVYFLRIKKKGHPSANGCEGLLKVGSKIRHYTVWEDNKRRIPITIDGNLRLFEMSEQGDIIFRSISEANPSNIPAKYDSLSDEKLSVKIGSKNAFAPIIPFRKTIREIVERN
jgi:hypothetical protein